MSPSEQSSSGPLGQQEPLVRVPPPGPISRSWAERLQSVEYPASAARRTLREREAGVAQAPIVYEQALGANVFDVDGNRYVDMAAGFGAALLGHGDSRPALALHEQSSRLWHALGDVYSADAKIQLLEQLARLHPEPGARVMLGQSGADAITAALKTALLTTRKPGVLAFEGSYHGLSYGPLALTSFKPSLRDPFAAQLSQHVCFAPFAARPDQLDRSLEAARKALSKGDIGAVVIEPVLGRGGCLPATSGFLQELATLTREAGALLIADEIWTGLGRSGAMLLSVAEGVIPDIVCLGKGLGGGLPLSATIGTQAAMEGWERGAGDVVHTATYHGAPLASATALSLLKTLAEERLVARSAQVGERFVQTLRQHTASSPHVLDVRGRGMMVGVELSSGALAFETTRALLSSGYIVLSGGPSYETLTLTPPLTLDEALLESFARTLSALLSARLRTMTFDVLARSEALHARVRAFADAAITGQPTESFDGLACDIARHQADASPAIARLWAARSLDPSSVTLAAHVPAVPTDAFKLARIAAHLPASDAIVFRTSGTTVGTRGEHPMRTTATYEHLALLFGEKMLRPDAAPVDVLVLAPPPSEAADSSLNFMCRLFGERWAGGAQFLLPGGQLDLATLTARIAEAHRTARPVMLLATSFALVHLLDEVGDLPALRLPPASRVMQTGGYKGKSREVSSGELRTAVARVFGIDERAVVSEYGMTELSSQFYEGSLRALLGAGAGTVGVLEAPPWMRITPVDPETLLPVADGEIGIARIEDLGNVDGAFAIQTQDRIEFTSGGFRLLGRLPGATPRGCSIAIEELLDERGLGLFVDDNRSLFAARSRRHTRAHWVGARSQCAPCKPSRSDRARSARAVAERNGTLVRGRRPRAL